MIKSDWIEIARSGHYPGKVPLTRGMFEEMVAALPRLTDGVPLTIGHPDGEALAWGWVTALDVRENGESGPDRGWSLWMQADLQDELAEMVRSDKLRNRSIGIDQDPTGAWYLWHVAFLGAVAPAVPGMEKIKMSADKSKQRCEVFEFAAAGGDGDTKQSRKGDNMLDKKSAPPAPGGNDPAPGMQEHTPAPVNEDYSYAASAELAKLRQELEAERRLRRVSEASAFCERLAAEGRLTPAMSAGLPELLAALPDGEASAFSYSISGAEKKTNPAAFMRAFLASLPIAVDFSERAKRPAGQGAMPPGGDGIEAQINAYLASNPGASVVTAVHALSQKED